MCWGLANSTTMLNCAKENKANSYKYRPSSFSTLKLIILEMSVWLLPKYYRTLEKLQATTNMIQIINEYIYVL